MIFNNTPSVLLYFTVLEASFCAVERYIFQLFLGMCFEAMLFSILGEILVQLGCQEEPKIAKQINENLSSFFNEILVDFGSPGAAFEVGCPR